MMAVWISKGVYYGFVRVECRGRRISRYVLVQRVETEECVVLVEQAMVISGTMTSIMANTDPRCKISALPFFRKNDG